MNPTCRECGAKCCKTLIVSDPGGSGGDLLRTRAIGERDGQLWIASPCKHLVANRCAIYGARPLACRVMDVCGAACNATREVVA